MAGSVSENAGQASLLIIEDDPVLSDLVARFLREHGFRIEQAGSGAEALRKSRERPYDLVICDLMLPDTHGFQLMERLRLTSKSPFLFLTAIDHKELQISGFELGAIDYVVKPVDPDVLLARIRSHLRSHSRVSIATNNGMQLTDFRLELENHRVETAGQELKLSNHEFQLLWTLVKYRNTVLSRDFLFNNTAERAYDGLDRTIDGRVSRLRKKLDGVAGCPYEVRTVWGKGYIFCERGRAPDDAT